MPAEPSETRKGNEKPKSVKFHIVVNPLKDPEIIEKLSSARPVSKYIKQLIRKDLQVPEQKKKVTRVAPVTGNRETDREIFHENFVKLSEMAKVSIRGFANALHVGSQTVFLWRAGKTYPQIEKMLEICKFFGVSRSEMHQKDFYKQGLEDHLLRSFNALSFEGKRKLMESAETLKVLYPNQDLVD